MRREQAQAPGTSATDPPLYPQAWELDGLLVDGEPVHLRPVRADDRLLLAAFHEGLSAPTVYYRYFGTHPVLSEKEITHLVELDYSSRMAFAALVSGQIVGIGRYEWGDRQGSAEVAFVVADAFQRRGVGTLLFESLVAYGAQKGVARFTAEVLPENPEMLRVFNETGLGVTTVSHDNIVEVAIDPTPTPEYADRRDERERSADAASMAFLLRPASVAVVGAGRTTGSIGHTIVRSLLAGDFAGTVYPVNPHARSICGVPAYPSLSSVPERVDVAIVAVPASQVTNVARDAASAGVRALVVVSSGFAELGDAGRRAQAELLRLARDHGMRVVGPNCLGICNTAADVRCNATFAPAAPVAGTIALASQSGAVGVVLLEQARQAGLGISSFVSVGNKIDVSGNDLLSYWDRDEATSVIALYLESFGNPRKFARIAKRVARRKPIVVLKGGRSPAGARGARSHTAAAATSEVTIAALLASSGVIEVRRLEEMLDVVGVLACSPLPQGRRVALVGNSGGPLILAADACVDEGLLVPELSTRTQAALADAAPPASACTNPVDITAGGGPEALEAVLELTLADTGVDSVIVVVTSLLSLSSGDARRVVERVAGRSSKPVIACLLGDTAPPSASDGRPRTVATVSAPERAAGALAKMADYATWRSTPEPSHPVFKDIEQDRVRELVDAQLAAEPEGGWLDSDAACAVLRAFGIPVVASTEVRTMEDARYAAETIGFPVALKAGSGEMIHKSDVGGVALDLRTPGQLASAYQSMARRLGDAFLPAVVQSMATGGVETIVGLSSDPRYGPLLLFGLGGVATDLLMDRSFAVPPLSNDDAERLITSIRSAPLLNGYRGSAVMDTAALRDVILRVAQLAIDVPEIAELDLNPVVVSTAGALVVDCKMRVAPVPSGPDALMRMLSQ